MLQGVLLTIAFFFYAGLMYKQKISSVLALLAMALTFGAICAIPVSGKTGMVQIIASGSIMLADAMVAVVFGAWLGEIMNETGITRDIIRRAAELGGDKPVILAILMASTVSILFTSLYGLGSVIMVGTLVLPILSAAGINPLAAGVIFIFSRSVGSCMNMVNWQLFMNISKVPVEPIRLFSAFAMAVCFLGVLSFIFIELRKPRTTWSAPNLTGNLSGISVKKVPALALLTPLIPFPFVILLKWPIVPALLLGCIYGVLTTNPRDSLRVLSKTVHDGLKAGAPAIVLMIAIGIVLKVVANPAVSSSLAIIMKPIAPTGAMSFFLFFVLLAPLALYRGPLNPFGLGSGVLALLIATQGVPAAALVAGFITCQAIQNTADPTNTHLVWTSDFLGLETNDITRKVVPYIWAVAAGSIAVATFMYF